MGVLRAERLQTLSLSRVLGFSCQRIWMFMMFYSIVPYLFSSNIRGTLYHHQTVSLFAFVLGSALVIAIFKPHVRIKQTRFLIWVGGALMIFGSVACYFSDISTSLGMLTATLAGIATGVGSSFIFILWMSVFFSMGPTIALIEYAIGTAVGMTICLLLVFAPAPVALAVISLCPVGTSFGLARAEAKLEDEPLSSHQASHQACTPSKSAKHLFAKALSGAFLFGLAQGLTDIVSGYTAFSATEQHGVFLLLSGILAALLMSCIALAKRDPLDTLYRTSMLFMGFGYVLTAFITEFYTFYSAVSFGGYMFFIAFILIAGGRISATFEIGITRASASSIGALYLGEGIGLAIGNGLTVIYEASLDIRLLSLFCVALFLLVHLFLFNETDLIHAGIGDMDFVEGVVAPMPSQDEKTENDSDEKDVFAEKSRTLAEQYSLSPREAEVLLLLLQGRTMARIQETLYISAGTVSTHMRHIYQKVGVSNKQQLLDKAFSENKG